MRHVEEAGDAEAEQGEGEQRVRPEPEARVHRPADHAEAVDRGQRDAERREPRVERPGRREDRRPGDEVGDEEEQTWKALPPKMSPIASAWSPSLTAAIPEEISGSAVAPASTVAPKITPLTPSRLASVVAALLERDAGGKSDEARQPEDRRHLSVDEPA